MSFFKYERFAADSAPVPDLYLVSNLLSFGNHSLRQTFRKCFYVPASQSNILSSAAPLDSDSRGLRFWSLPTLAVLGFFCKRLWNICRILHIIHCEKVLAHRSHIGHLPSDLKSATFHFSYPMSEIFKTFTFQSSKFFFTLECRTIN